MTRYSPSCRSADLSFVEALESRALLSVAMHAAPSPPALPALPAAPVRHAHNANSPPVARLVTSATESPAVPFNVIFDATGSFDLNGDQLGFLWNFGDGNTAQGVAVQHTYEQAGIYTASLLVTDGHGGKDSARVIITAGLSAPQPTITLPTTSTTFAPGDTIRFSGSAVDLQDGILSPSALTWSFQIVRGAHIKTLVSAIQGVASGAITVPRLASGDPAQRLRVTLIATNSAGLRGSTHVDLLPQTATLSLQSNFDGLRVLVNGRPVITPINVQGIVNAPLRLAAPVKQILNGVTYEFISWTDHGGQGGRVHDILLPPGGQTVLVTYRFIHFPQPHHPPSPFFPPPGTFSAALIQSSADS